MKSIDNCVLAILTDGSGRCSSSTLVLCGATARKFDDSAKRLASSIKEENPQTYDAITRTVGRVRRFWERWERRVRPTEIPTVKFAVSDVGDLEVSVSHSEDPSVNGDWELEI